ncbi:HMG1/2-like protein [Lotus japonicus]|uniref:HMG1/2-like protein n=1 Tax=Lotus japonicus TaxID=34305 RepID=UPI002583679A|nr:HMG1/2-like protein [Lotus japonicus]
MKGGNSRTGSKSTDSKLAVKKNGGGVTKPARNTAWFHKLKTPPPPDEFLVFLRDFVRKQFNKELHDNKPLSAAIMAKAACSKWKTMSDAEKASYAAEAQRLKTAYYENHVLTEKLKALNM